MPGRPTSVSFSPTNCGCCVMAATRCAACSSARAGGRPHATRPPFSPSWTSSRVGKRTATNAQIARSLGRQIDRERDLMMHTAKSPLLGIVQLGERCSVCLGEHVVATEVDDEAVLAQPASAAHRAARIVCETYAAITDRELADPLVLNLQQVCWWVEADRMAVRSLSMSGASDAETLLEASRDDDPLFLAVFAQGGLEAAAR